MNLLRLDGEEDGNGCILFELEKYIFNSCENIWDIDFLAHRYAIVKILFYVELRSDLKLFGEGGRENRIEG